MRRFSALLAVSALSAAVLPAQRRVVDAACGVEIALPSPVFAQIDQSARGAVVHLYSPAATGLPRVTVMRFPAIFLRGGLETRAQELAAARPGFERVRLEKTELAGEPAEVLEYTVGDERAIEVGAVLDDALLIVQVAASEADWKDPAKAARYRAVHETLRLVPVEQPEPELDVDTKTPAEVRERRAALAPPPRAFAITRHDLQAELAPATGGLTVRDEFTVEALAETVKELDLRCRVVDGMTLRQDGTPLRWRRRSEDEIAVALAAPLAAGESATLRFEATHADFDVRVENGLIAEMAVFGQVEATSSYSSHVLWYPIDRRNDAAVAIALTVPEGYTAVSGGEPRGTSTAPGGRTTFRYEMPLRAPRALPFGFAAARYERLGGATPGGVELEMLFPPGKEKEARQRLEIATASGAQLEKMMGPLPWGRVAFCWVRPREKESGVSLPGQVLLSDRFFGDAAGVELRGSRLNDPATLGLLIVADELSHQWNFYSVGLPNELAEGISTFTNLLLIEARRGATEYADGLAFCAQAYLSVAESARDFAVADPALYRSPSYRTVAFCKVPVVLDLLRRRLGDETFFAAWRKAFTELRGQSCDYQDLERELAQASGTELRGFFDQWLLQAGHPRLDVAWSVDERDGARLLRLDVRQTQPGGLFALEVPVAITGAGGTQRGVIETAARETTVEIALDEATGAVEKVAVDPDRTLRLLRARVRANR